MAEALRAILHGQQPARPATKDAPGVPAASGAEQLARALYDAALAGNLAAASVVLDRAEGKVPDLSVIDQHVRDGRRPLRSALELDREQIDRILDEYAGARDLDFGPQ